MESTFFPTFMNVRDRTCLVIGAGPIGVEKIEGLLASDARVVVVAPEAEPEVVDLAAEGSITWHQRRYEPTDLDGALLVFAATSDTDLNVRVFREAESRAMLVNIVDVPPLCNFIMPAIVRNGAVSIAISTSGASPALAKRLKREIADEFGAPYALLAELLNDIRGWAKSTFATYQERKVFFEDIVNGDPDPIELLRAGDEAAARELIAAAQRAHEPATA